jgi:hypothetical protein
MSNFIAQNAPIYLTDERKQYVFTAKPKLQLTKESAMIKYAICYRHWTSPDGNSTFGKKEYVI